MHQHNTLVRGSLPCRDTPLSQLCHPKASSRVCTPQPSPRSVTGNVAVKPGQRYPPAPCRGAVLKVRKKETLTFLNKLCTAAFPNCYVSLSMARDEASPEPIEWKVKELEVSKSVFLTENIFFTKCGSVFLRTIPNKNRQSLVRTTWAEFLSWDYSITGFIYFITVTRFEARKTKQDLSVLTEHFRPFCLENPAGLLLLCKMENSKPKASFADALQNKTSTKQWWENKEE